MTTKIEWQEADVYDFIHEEDKELIYLLIFEALVDMGYMPDKVNWDFKVKFIDGFYRKTRENEQQRHSIDGFL